MKTVQKFFYAFLVAVFASMPFVANAVGGTAVTNGFDMSQTSSAASSLSNKPLWNLIANLLNWLLGIIGALAVVVFVIAGILYITAAGNEEQVEKAKTTMTYAIIGLVVALLGLVIVNAVAGLTGAGISGSILY